MEQAVRFDEVLEEKLAGVGPAGPPPAARPFPFAPPLGFFYFPAQAFAVSAPGGRGGSPRCERPVRGGSGPRRTLSSRQQQALEALVALGARLDADFTGTSLRSAFRSLARRLHPDRHPGSSEAERARLAAQFAQVHEAYRCLRPLAAVH